jgi:hypothetical protein
MIDVRELLPFDTIGNCSVCAAILYLGAYPDP